MSNVERTNLEKEISKEEKLKKINLLLDKLESSISKLEKKQPKNLENIISKANEYWENTNKILIELKNKSKEINSPSLIELTDIVIQCLCFQQDLLTLCCSFQKPDERGMNVIFSRFKILMKPISKYTSDPLTELQALCVENGLNVLCWLFNDFECDIIAKTYFESIDIPLNQIMVKTNKDEIEWFKIFKNLLKNVVNYVEQEYKNGLYWMIRGNNEINELILELGSTYRNNFYTENYKNENELKLEMEKLYENKNKIRLAVESGEIKKKLKPIVKKEENISEIKEEEENNNNEKEKINFSSSTFFHPGVRKSFSPKELKENYEENKNIMIFENYIDLNKIIENEKLEIGTFLKIVNCVNCTFTITKRINKILILNCENCNLFCGELISDIEMINCSKIRVTCSGAVNLAIVYRSKDIVFFLNSISKNLRVRRSFSSNIMLKINKDPNEEYKESVDILLPEQFVFKINEEKKLEINYIAY